MSAHGQQRVLDSVSGNALHADLLLMDKDIPMIVLSVESDYAFVEFKLHSLKYSEKGYKNNQHVHVYSRESLHDVVVP